MQRRIIFSLGCVLGLGCARAAPKVPAPATAELAQLAARATEHFHIAVSRVALAPSGELNIEVAGTLAQASSATAWSDTLRTIARWTWSVVEQHHQVRSLAICCLLSRDPPITRVFPNRRALFANTDP